MKDFNTVLAFLTGFFCALIINVIIHSYSFYKLREEACSLGYAKWEFNSGDGEPTWHWITDNK